MIANIVFQFFLKGGPVMWPLLVCALMAVAVVGERAFWWWRETRRRDVHQSWNRCWPRWNTRTSQRASDWPEAPTIRLFA